MADIVLISPCFEVSFWGLEHALPLLGKRAAMPPASLALLAALTPPGHTVTLVDENIEAIDYDRCARADIVGLTGMSVQRGRMRAILMELKRRGAFTVVGGPWVTVEEDAFGPLADVVFVGEAEATWPLFLAEWAEGRHKHRYEQAERTDMTAVPAPRLDLLRMRDYAFGSLQVSRGCPFTCEFCDIIVTFGRRPRLKAPAQILAELDGLLAAGVRFAFVVDDNLIGDRRAVRPVLRAVADWQAARGHRLPLMTEASLDLAEDPDLMRLMLEAGIAAVFVGVESPNEASLRETRKLQNLRGDLPARVRAIQDAGLEVFCGMILGFDHDDAAIFAAHRRFLDEARVAVAMIGMLSAIPKTPLHARLAREGRLDPADPEGHGTNVVPLRMGREELRDGYRRLMAEAYAPAAFLARLDSLYLEGGFATAPARRRLPPWRRLAADAALLAQATLVLARLLWRVPEPALRREYARRCWRVARARRDPFLLLAYAVRCAMHHHFRLLARGLASGPVVNSI